MLPHGYPLRLIDPISAAGGGGPARVRLTAASAFLRSEPWPPMLGVEVLAQAAACRLASTVPPTSTPGDPEEGAPLLAGIDRVSFAPELADRPLAAGDELLVTVEEVARFGRLVKIQGSLERRGQVVIEGSLMLAG